MQLHSWNLVKACCPLTLIIFSSPCHRERRTKKQGNSLSKCRMSIPTKDLFQAYHHEIIHNRRSWEYSDLQWAQICLQRRYTQEGRRSLCWSLLSEETWCTCGSSLSMHWEGSIHYYHQLCQTLWPRSLARSMNFISGLKQGTSLIW